MNTLQTLKSARELLSNPERWTQHVYARDAKSKPCHETSPEAVQWCAIGALYKVNDDCPLEAMEALRSSLNKSEMAVGEFNDNRTHAEVMDLFDRTIAKLEPKP